MCAQSKAHLLVCSSDPGAALNIVEILRYIRGSRQLRVSVLSGTHSEAIFESAGFVPAFVVSERVSVGKSLEGVRFAAKVSSYLRVLNPDAILVGLSGPDCGLDEVLIALARGLPTYAVQDFWGDVNPGFGFLPQTYFVHDDFAARLTRLRAPESTVEIVGSCKHVSYDKFDTLRLRDEFRASVGASRSERVFLYCGQPLWDLRGYAETLFKVGRALGQVAPGSRLYYRPHPKESREDVVNALRLMKADGTSPEVDASSTVELSLCGSDLTLSCFSTCGLDLAYLTRSSRNPLGSMVFAMFEKDIRTHYSAYTKLECVPLHAQGLAGLVENSVELESIIKMELCGPKNVKDFNRARSLPDPRQAPERVVRKILSDLAKGNGNKS